jgi:rRNA processing protein Gar1
MFHGEVVRPSHEGGILISFTGSSPALGSTIETESGIRLGKVDTVIGSIHKPWVHVYPISKGLDVVDVLGQNTVISSNRTTQSSRPRREERNSNFSRNNFRNEKTNLSDNDWICSKCSNDNFGWRESCNKCSAPKDGRGRSDSPRRGRDSGRDSGRSEKKVFNDNDWICSKCSNDNFSWRESCNKCSAPKDGRGGSDSPRRGRDSGRSDGPRKWGNSDRSDSPRRGRDSGRSDGPRKWGNSDRSDSPRRGRDSGKESSQDKKSNAPKRLRGKSRSHFKNRDLDDIFKKNQE